jgi:hypothetical protein
MARVGLGCNENISEFPKVCVSPDPNQLYIFRRLVPPEGALAIVTDVGAGCGGRKLRFDECAGLADGEVVWS